MELPPFGEGRGGAFCIVGNEDMGHLLSCLSHGEESNGYLYTYTLLYIYRRWVNEKVAETVGNVANCLLIALTLSNLGGVSTIQVEKACAFSLNCIQLALTLNNLGCVSTIQVEKACAFSLNCVRLALTFNNLGCVSTIQVEKACAFSLNCVRLALTFNNLGCVSTIQVEKTMFFL